MIVFLEGGKANGCQIKISSESITHVMLEYSGRALRYEEAKPFRLWQGLPVWVECEIEIPQSRLDCLGQDEYWVGITRRIEYWGSRRVKHA